MKPTSPPIRADHVAAFNRREPELCHQLVGVDPVALQRVMDEWEALRDWMLGPRLQKPDGQIVRVMGRGFGHILFGEPEPAPFYDPAYCEGMKERTQAAGGFTDRETDAVVLLEEIRSDACLWRFARKRSWRVVDRRHREMYRRGSFRVGGSLWTTQEEFDRSRAEYEAQRQAYFDRFGSRRPREFWQEAVVRLRIELALMPKEIYALAEEFRPWWQAERRSVEIALRRARARKSGA